MREEINWVIAIEAAGRSLICAVCFRPINSKYMFTKARSAQPAMRTGNGVKGRSRKGLRKDKGPGVGQTHTGWAAAQSRAHCSVSQKTDLATDLEFQIQHVPNFINHQSVQKSRQLGKWYNIYEQDL